MPGRTCQLCQVHHQVVKGYQSAKGVFEHVVIQDPAQNIYICEICRSCICQDCGRSFLAETPSAWRKHLLFSSTAASDHSRCPGCSNSAKPSAPATSPCRRRPPEAVPEFGRRVLERGAGPGSCAACLALFGGGGQAQQPAGGQSSRYPTDPLPQGKLRQQQQQQEDFIQGGFLQGHTTAMSWPGAPTTSSPAGPPAAAVAPHHGIPHHMAAQQPPSWQSTPSAPYSATSTTATTSSFSSDSRNWQDPLLRAQRQQPHVNPSAPPWTAATAAAGLPGQQLVDWPAAGARADPRVGAGGMVEGTFGHQVHGATVPPCGAGGIRGAGLPARGDGYATTVRGVGGGTMQQQIKVLDGVLVIESVWAE